MIRRLHPKPELVFDKMTNNVQKSLPSKGRLNSLKMLSVKEYLNLLLSQGWPHLSHVVFANDLLLFAKAEVILDRRCVLINPKSIFLEMFLGNELLNWRSTLGSLYSIKGTTKIPISVNQGLSTWKIKQLSFVGRVTLTKSMLQALPTYMSNQQCYQSLYATLLTRSGRTLYGEILISLERFMSHHGALYIHLKAMSQDGKFYSKEAYNLFSNIFPTPNKPTFKMIWKLRIGTSKNSRGILRNEQCVQFAQKELNISFTLCEIV
ncbi:hypothetical protein CR513_58548, partial [Mucuna pruriens]